MKLILAFLISLLGLGHAQAQSSTLVCELEQVLESGPDYEDVNDFTFADTPYLLIKSENNKIEEVVIGQLPYDPRSTPIEIRSLQQNGQKVIQILYVENNVESELIKITFSNQGLSIDALVESSESDTEGRVAQFKNCHNE